MSVSVHVLCDCNRYWCLFCFCCHIQHTMSGGSVWLYEAVLLAFALYLWSYLVLMFMYYTVCYFTGIFYAVVRPISMLFIDPSVNAVAQKIPWSFCQRWRWQVAAEHACTLRMWLYMKWRDLEHGCMVYTERVETAAVSRDTSHVTAK